MAGSRKNTHNEGGFTLTELAMVLGVVGIILGAIWGSASMVYKKMQVNEGSRGLQGIVAKVRSIYASRHAFSYVAPTDITKALVQSGVFPASMPIVNGYPVSPWGGMVYVWAYSNPTYGNQSFRVSFYAIPNGSSGGDSLTNQLCTGLASAALAELGNDGPVGFITKVGLWATFTGLDTIDATTIADACAQNTPAGASVEFDYLLY